MEAGFTELHLASLHLRYGNVFKPRRDSPAPDSAIDADKMWRDCARKLALFRAMVAVALAPLPTEEYFPQDVTRLIFLMLVGRWSFLATAGYIFRTSEVGDPPSRERVFRYVINTPYLWSPQRHLVPSQSPLLQSLLLSRMIPLLINFVTNSSKWKDGRVVKIEPDIGTPDPAFRFPYLRTTGEVFSVYKVIVQVPAAVNVVGRLARWEDDMREATFLCANPEARVVFMS